MKLIRLAFKPATAVPMLALTFASAITVALLCARVIWTGRIQYAGLIWNLFLAWMPLIFALLAAEKYQNGPARNWRFVGLTIAWLLFFPNAPYIFTDVIHLNTSYFAHFWVDLMLVLLCALTGMVIGFLSLYLMQSLVAHRYGRLASWLFIAAVAGLSSFGICLGRFLRFNSWDVLIRPVELYRGIGTLVADPFHASTLAFPFLLATFLFITYVMLYALTHLHHAVPSTLNSMDSTA